MGDLSLAEARRRLAANLFSNAREGIFITDTEGLIVDANPALTTLTGYTREEMLGQNFQLFASGHQGDGFYKQLCQTVLNTGIWQGMTWNRDKNGEVYHGWLVLSAVRDASNRITHTVGVCSDLTRRHDVEGLETSESQVHYDPLTGLANYYLAWDRLRQAVTQMRRDGKIVAVCLIEINGLKAINTTHGYRVGDAVLLEVAQRLRQGLRTGDTAARSDAKRFLILLPELTWVEEVDLILSRLLRSFVSPYEVGEHRLTLSFNIGVTLFPQDGETVETLLTQAHTAVAVARQAGVNRYRLFNAEHNRLLQTYRTLLSDLSEALRNDQFLLYYQPRVNLRGESVDAVEALLRWRHPERGLLAPAEFLYAVDGSALEIPLGRWVLQRALRQLDAWHSAGLRLRLSVNLAVRQLDHPDFVKDLTALLAAYPVDRGQWLELEIQESALLINMSHVASNIKACQTLGVRVSLDDFGSGHLSVVAFNHLPVNALKIDQTLVRDMLDDPDDMAVVESIIKLGKAFERDVIAEGVENIEQGAMLIHLGCYLAQGYVIARPMAADRVAEWTPSWKLNAAWQSMAALSVAREDVVLMVAEHSHRHWMRQMVDFINGKPHAVLPPVEPHHCEFGRWLHNQGQQRYQQLSEFAEVVHWHEEVHHLANRLIRQVESDPEGARNDLGAFQHSSEQLIGAISSLIVEVVAGFEPLDFY